jgi:hypothetical protein
MEQIGRREAINQTMHTLATIDVLLNNEALIFLGWEEKDDQLHFTFKHPSEQRIVFSFPLYTQEEDDHIN